MWFLAQLLLLIFMSFHSFSYSDEKISVDGKIKVLHLSFHKGCIREFDSVAKHLSLDVDSWYIPDLPDQFFDGMVRGNALYNVTHERAQRIWNKHKRVFESFDVVVVSDTAPLSRIFLQNGWTKPLVIWVCNRFDYADNKTKDGDFPDLEYYELFRKATMQDNIFVIPYSEFDRYYARKKGIEINHFLISPCAPESPPLEKSLIPPYVIKQDYFFLPPYQNETCYIDLTGVCRKLGIDVYCGKYNGPADLKDFKGIIHLPYNWSNLAFFENCRFGIPYFVPSEKFLRELMAEGDYFHADIEFLKEENQFALSEWYSKEHKEVITYFDSWLDLKEKTLYSDFRKLHQKIKRYSAEHYELMFDRWTHLFQKIESRIPKVKEIPPRTTASFVMGRLIGQLGNQFFIIAATTSLALKNGATPIFPDFVMNNEHFDLKVNYEKIFSKVHATPPLEEVEYYYQEPHFTYSSIPYHDNMEMRGWFQSEKYFIDHKQQIIELFSPSEEILSYLQGKYAHIIDHPMSVAIHYRSYLKEDPLEQVYAHLSASYYKAAMDQLPDEALFVVFSQDIEWCKENLAPLKKNMLFIESERHYHDFYLMTLCKHNIICNSTFSWWGAYLNKNPNKKVFAPLYWFAPSYHHDTRDLIPDSWMLITKK